MWQNSATSYWFLILRDNFEHSQIQVGEDLALFKLMELSTD